MTACSVAALTEPLAGTAPHRPVWALIEHPGPWGRDALLDAPWPTPGLGEQVQRALDDAGVRVVLARRHGRQPRGENGPMDGAAHVILARCGALGWAGATTLPGAADLLRLDWARLAGAARAPRGWADPGRVWAVCTQGSRDACCARVGRPVAAAFAALEPRATWEISHSGGHRFAGVALALPEGLLYGRVTPADAAELVQARAGDRVVPRLLRGALDRSPAQQAAEAALRDRLDDARAHAFEPLDQAIAPEPGTPVRTRWRHLSAVDGSRSTWQVDVVQRPTPARPASCGKPSEAATSWQVVRVERGLEDAVEQAVEHAAGPGAATS